MRTCINCHTVTTSCAWACVVLTVHNFIPTLFVPVQLMILQLNVTWPSMCFKLWTAWSGKATAANPCWMIISGTSRPCHPTAPA